MGSQHFPVGGGPGSKIWIAGKVCAKKIGSRVFLAGSRVFLAQILLLSRIFRIFGPDSRMDSSEGNLNRGFSMKNYPNFYFPNIFPASDIAHINSIKIYRIACSKTTLLTWRNCRLPSPPQINSLSVCQSVHYIQFNYSVENRPGPIDLVKYCLKNVI